MIRVADHGLVFAMTTVEATCGRQSLGATDAARRQSDRTSGAMKAMMQGTAPQETGTLWDRSSPVYTRIIAYGPMRSKGFSGNGHSESYSGSHNEDTGANRWRSADPG